MKIRWKELIISLLVALGVGALSAFVTRDSMMIYGQIETPPLAPPSWLFPVVWTILFALMGISSYLVYVSSAKNKRTALTIYAVQLIVNFIWPILFFNMQAYTFAFVWLIILWALVLSMIVSFYRARPIAGYLQIPYLIWLTFAAYLNLAIAILN